MNIADLKDVLKLVKEKLASNAEPACGIFWADDSITAFYMVAEPEDVEEG